MAGAKKDARVRVVRVGDNVWAMELPRVTWEVMDGLDRAVEALGEDDVAAAELQLRKLVDEHPEWIDGRHHLALVLAETGRHDEALAEWEAAVETGMAALPPGFYLGRDLLPWGLLENRPFLRALHGLGLARLQQGLSGEARSIFQDILDLNPDDNQGVRYLLIDRLLALRRPGDVLRFTEGAPEDPVLLYTVGLAHYMLGDREAAREALAGGVAALPLIAKELLKTRHVEPPSAMPGYITWGGADQAYEYWQEAGHFWEGTRGARAFLQAVVEGKPAPARPGRKGKERDPADDGA